MSNWNILTECYIDTLLVKTLSPAKQYNHQYSCNNVLKTMSEKFPDEAALGIIDNDNDKQKLLKTFTLVNPFEFELLALYQIGEKPHFVITIGSQNKAVENFILKNAEKCNIALKDYDLPDNLKELIQITKHSKSLKNAEQNFKRLFSILKQNENSDFFVLKNWLELFKENPYDFKL